MIHPSEWGTQVPILCVRHPDGDKESIRAVYESTICNELLEVRCSHALQSHHLGKSRLHRITGLVASGFDRFAPFPVMCTHRSCTY